ncbi:response regulator [Myxosarcina sp. GI1]|uniref:response regulator n=1 Tax=Myxosarcina sp. GI1 TaxID=1541065 RepID=UPI000692005B|nr:response regulator [Myxosarcina sp. GI1]
MNQMQSEFSHQLIDLSQQQFTGKIIVQFDPKTTWYIYLCLGRLVWCDGGIHSNRSWKRLTDKYCSQVNWNELKLENLETFERINYCILNFLIQKQLIKPETATEIVRVKAIENLFDLLQLETQQSLKISTEVTSASTFLVSASTRSISLVSIEELINEAERDWQNWQQIGLKNVSPNLAPTIHNSEKLKEEVSPDIYQNFHKLLDGKRTLRDLSYLMGRPVSKLAVSLLPYIRQELLALQKVKDINPPQYNSKTAASAAVPSSTSIAPLIACIDDSPQICKIMEQIITKQGYRFVSIQESLQALPTLIKVNPQLIFLDIGMPVVNGYEVCLQIKKVSKLQDIPVVFLTGNDGIVDRVRAKVTGASDFLSKPIEISKINNVIEKYLTQEIAYGTKTN